MRHDELAGQMLRTLTADIRDTVGCDVRLVSVTLDATAPIPDTASLVFETGVDRKTRTLVFCNGRAMGGAGPVMTATAVFAIQP